MVKHERNMNQRVLSSRIEIFKSIYLCSDTELGTNILKSVVRDIDGCHFKAALSQEITRNPFSGTHIKGSTYLWRI